MSLAANEDLRRSLPSASHLVVPSEDGEMRQELRRPASGPPLRADPHGDTRLSFEELLERELAIEAEDGSGTAPVAPQQQHGFQMADSLKRSEEVPFDEKARRDAEALREFEELERRLAEEGLGNETADSDHDPDEEVPRAREAAAEPGVDTYTQSPLVQRMFNPPVQEPRGPQRRHLPAAVRRSDADRYAAVAPAPGPEPDLASVDMGGALEDDILEDDIADAAVPQRDAALQSLVQQKVAELDLEIARYKQETARAKRVTQQHQEHMQALKDQTGDFEKWREAERTKLDAWKAEQETRMRRERHDMQRRLRMAQNAIPDRKERNELDKMKEDFEEASRRDQERAKRDRANLERMRRSNEQLQDRVRELEEQVKVYEEERLKRRQDEQLEQRRQEAAIRREERAREAEERRRHDEMIREEDRRIEEEELEAARTRPDDHALRQSGEPALRHDGVDEDVRGGDYVVSERQIGDGKYERQFASGKRVVTFNNGTVKDISPNGDIVVAFANGDTKKTFSDSGLVVYYYADAKTTHTTYKDGTQVFEFPNGQVERHMPDESKIIEFPDGTVKVVAVDGVQRSTFPDGTTLVEHPNGKTTVYNAEGVEENV